MKAQGKMCGIVSGTKSFESGLDYNSVTDNTVGY